jgi:hypothetical protein
MGQFIGEHPLQASRIAQLIYPFVVVSKTSHTSQRIDTKLTPAHTLDAYRCDVVKIARQRRAPFRGRVERAMVLDTIATQAIASTIASLAVVGTILAAGRLGVTILT